MRIAFICTKFQFWALLMGFHLAFVGKGLWRGLLNFLLGFLCIFLPSKWNEKILLPFFSINILFISVKLDIPSIISVFFYPLFSKIISLYEHHDYK